MKFKIVLLFFLVVVLGFVNTAMAEVDPTMGQISCEDYNEKDENERTPIISYVDGYLKSKSNTTITYQAWLEGLMEQVDNFCEANPKANLGQIMEILPEETKSGEIDLGTIPCFHFLDMGEAGEENELSMWVKGFAVGLDLIDTMSDAHTNLSSDLHKFCTDNPEEFALGFIDTLK